ncbi:unnamed protein product [Paramecium primaurelia]|uniref:Uncharacterized protein n=1 Tax=Paramecium primaurelia TaxID=5886 RepID=A0A8S1LTI5_PARPR|nr:unnamed protein product [Paramecium primaurelia]
MKHEYTHLFSSGVSQQNFNLFQNSIYFIFMVTKCPQLKEKIRKY